MKHNNIGSPRSEYERIDKNLRTLTKIMWIISGLSFITMFLSIACAVIVILLR